MKNPSLVFVLSILLIAAPPCIADENIIVSARQIQALGITTSPLTGKRSGEVSGLPALVVIPGNQMHIISAPLPAMIEQTLVGVGDKVKKGQIIAQLQSPALAEAQRGLLQATVQSQLAHENLMRDDALYKDGIISESRYRTTRGLALETAASLSERKQLLHLSGMSDHAIKQLQSGNSPTAQLTLTSPIDGVVLEKTASAGQRLDAAVPVFKIARVDQLSVEIQAPLAAIRDLRTGAQFTISAYAAGGKITAIGRSLTGANQTVLLRGTILQGSDNLRPGQFVEVSINTIAGSQSQWEIPNSAISRIDGHSVVFASIAQGFRPVTIRIINEGAVNSVISGTLKDDEIIAVGGVSALKSSMMGIGGGDK